MDIKGSRNDNDGDDRKKRLTSQLSECDNKCDDDDDRPKKWSNRLANENNSKGKYQ